MKVILSLLSYGERGQLHDSRSISSLGEADALNWNIQVLLGWTAIIKDNLYRGEGGGNSQVDRSKGEEDDYSKNLRITAQAVMPLGRRRLLLRLIILYFREIEWQRTKRPVHPLVLVNKYNMIVINIYFIEMNVSLWVSFKIILFCCLRPFTVRLLQNTS